MATIPEGARLIALNGSDPAILDTLGDRLRRVVEQLRCGLSRATTRARMIRDIRSVGVTSSELIQIQEGLRGVIRLPSGTAHELVGGDFPIPVMGKTGTTSDFRDALFVGSTYGPQGITVAVRIGFDDNRTLGGRETGGRTALPIFREIMLRVYKDKLAGPIPRFPPRIEQEIDAYLAPRASLEAEVQAPSLIPAGAGAADELR